MHKFVTCPETAHLELIELEDSPVGTLIRACSAFRPACAMTCARTCAARLDRRARLRDEDPAVSDEDTGVDGRAYPR